MQPLPLHPMIVHVPLILAMLSPLVLGGAAWLLWRGRGDRRPLLVAIALQAIVFGGGLLGLRSGEAEEHRVEPVVGEALVEAHEEGAERFVAAAGVVLALIVGATVLPRTGARVVAPLALAGTLVVAGLGVATGHAGGALVYRHGAGAAFGPLAAAEGTTPRSAAWQDTAGDDDDDD